MSKQVIQLPLTSESIPSSMSSTFRLWGGEMTARLYIGDTSAVMIVTAIDGTCDSYTPVAGIDTKVWAANLINKLAHSNGLAPVVELVNT